MISDILNLYYFIDKKLENASVLKALSSWDGTRKYGSKEINVHLSGNPLSDKIWFYDIMPYKNFIFIPFPVNPGVNVDFGKAQNEVSPDSKYFRYVASPLAKFASEGEENVKVDFVVFGYLVEDLLTKMKDK